MNTDLAKENKIHPWPLIKREFHDIVEEKKGFVFILWIFAALLGGSYGVGAIFTSKFVIEALQAGDEASLWRAVLVGYGSVLGMVALFGGLSGWVQSIFCSVRCSRFNVLAKRMINVDYSFLESKDYQDRILLGSQALEGDNRGYEGALGRLFQMSYSLVGAILYIVMISFYVPWIIGALLLIPVIRFLLVEAGRHYEFRHEKDYNERTRHLHQFETIGVDFSYGKDLRLNDMEEPLNKAEIFAKASYLDLFRSFCNHRYAYGLLEALALLIEDGLAYGLLTYLTIKGHIGIGDLVVGLGGILSFDRFVETISHGESTLLDDCRMVYEYYHFIDDETLVSSSGSKKAIEQGTLEVVFDDVSFKYPDTDRYVLKHLNLTIHKGERLAVVGLNGAGKSTIVKLITGLFSPTEGTIYINGIPQAEFDKKEYWNMFSVVYQDVKVIAGSIIENVAGDNLSPEERERAIDCIDSVGLKEKIASLPHTYDTSLLKVIDSEGVELSGGETQKLAIARALYKDGNMVLLDEPTSALDALAEASIYNDFDHLVKGKTSVYISHRLSSTKFCDEIALFDNDGLKEYGTHDELIAKKGEYYKLFITQGKYYQTEEGGQYEKE